MADTTHDSEYSDNSIAAILNKPDPKITSITSRHVVTKLELPTAEPRVQLDLVSKKVFDLEPDKTKYAKDNSKWHATDEVFQTAKKSYQSVIDPFTEMPRVYKLESTKEKLIAFRLAQVSGTSASGRAPLKRSNTSRGYLDRIARQRAKDAQFLEDEIVDDDELTAADLTEEEKEELELATLINPFAPPHPWVRKTRPNGEVVYVNLDTKQMTSFVPGEIWQDKYSNLERLTPREDLSGWEYREDEQERRRRFRVQQEFEKRVAAEVERRSSQPNELEQVEDALFHIVDTICRRDARKKWEEKIAERDRKRAVWHPSTKGFRLEPLEPIKNAAAEDDSEGIPVITDLDFNDNCTVTVSGFVLANVRPWNLLKIHENERLLQKMREDAETAALMAIRNKPVKEKFEELMELAKEDPKLAAHHLAQGLRNRAMEIPLKIKALDKKVIMDSAKTKAVQGATGLIKALRDPRGTLVTVQETLNAAYRRVFPPSKEEQALEAMMHQMEEEEKSEEQREQEARAKAAEEMRALRRKGMATIKMENMNPVPVTHPDCVFMTVTLLEEPPSLYERVPPPKWYDPAIHLQKDIVSLMADHHGDKPPTPRKPPKYRYAREKLDLYSRARKQVALDDEYMRHGDSEDEEEGIDDASSLNTMDNSVLSNSILAGGGVVGRHRSSGPAVSSVDALASVAEEGNNNEIGNAASDEHVMTPTHGRSSPRSEVDKRSADRNEGVGINGPTKDIGESDINIPNSASDPVVDSGSENAPMTAVENSDGSYMRSNPQDADAADNVINSDGTNRTEGGADSPSQTAEEDVLDGIEESKKTDRDEKKSDADLDGIDDTENVGQDIKTEDGANSRNGTQNEDMSAVGSAVRENAEIEEHESDNGNTDSYENPTSKDNASIDNAVDDMTEGGPESRIVSQARNTVPGNGDTSGNYAAYEESVQRNTLGDDGSGRMQSDDESEEDSSQKPDDYSNSTLTTKANKPPPVPPVSTTSSAPPPGGENALSKYQISALTKTIWRNLKDRRNDAATPEVKDIFDNSRRVKFEEKLIDEISTAACIPAKFFRIEEIKRLEKNDPRLLERKKAKEDYFIEQKRLAEEERRRQAAEWQKTLDLVKRMEEKRARTASSVGSVSRGGSIEDGSTCSVGANVNGRTDNNEDKKSADTAIVNKQVGVHENIEDEEMLDGEDEDAFMARVGGETEEQRKKRLKAAARKASVAPVGVDLRSHASGDSPAPSLGHVSAPSSPEKDHNSTAVSNSLELNSHLEMPSYDASSVGNIDHFPLEDGMQCRSVGSVPGVVMLDGRRIDLNPSTPVNVTYTKFGITNPAEINRDPKYWLARELRELTEEERRQKRLRILQTLQLKGHTRVSILKKRLAKIRQKQAELSAIAEMYVGPALKGVISKVAPVAEELAHKSKQCSKSAKESNGDVTEHKEHSNEKTSDVDVAVRRMSVAEEAAAIGAAAKSSEEESKNRETISQIRTLLDTEEQAMIKDIEETDLTESDLEGQRRPPLTDMDGNEILSLENLRKNVVPKVEVSDSKELRQDDGEEAHTERKDDHSVCDSDRGNGLAIRTEADIINEMMGYMLTAVERHGDSPYDIYDEYLQIFDEGDEVQANVVRGCEVTFLVHVDSTLMEHIYLRELQAEDIAAFIQQQVYDLESELHMGSLTKNIVDVRFKPAFKKRVNFTGWEHLWVHFISPVFFRYNTKTMKPDKYVGGQSKGRLKGGIIVINPVDTFTEAQKTTFMGLIHPPSKLDEGPLLDFNVDDLGQEISGDGKTTIFRPNMSELTKRDVEKCKRVMRLYKEKYDDEMRHGLVDGKRLRLAQYRALKEYETTKRIYELAKQKLARDERAEKDGDLLVPHITKITPEVFKGWMKEAKEEEAMILKEARLKATQMKELRKQEAEMRKRYDQQKSWMYSKLLQQSRQDSQQLAQHVRRRLEEIEEESAKANSSTASAALRESVNAQRATARKHLIHEEKMTRKLWQNMLRRHQEDKMEKEQASDDMSMVSDTTGLSRDSTHASQNVAEPVPHEDAMKYLLLAKSRYLFDENWKKKMEERDRKEKERLRKEKRRLQMERAKRLREEQEGVSSSSIPTTDGSTFESLATGGVLEDATSVESGSGAVTMETSEEMEKYSSMSEPIRKFTDDDMETFRQLSWFKNIVNHIEFYECLRQFPVMKPGEITRDEMIQFAKLNAEIGPVIFKARETMRLENEDKSQDRNKKNQKQKDRRALRRQQEEKAAADMTEAEAYKKAMQEGLAEEAAKRAKRMKAAAKRRAKREKAWLYAHQHLYVKIPGDVPYCVVCRERTYSDWLESHMKAEKSREDDIEKIMSAARDEYEASIRQELEDKHMELIAKQRQQRIEALQQEALTENRDVDDISMDDDISFQSGSLSLLSFPGDDKSFRSARSTVTSRTGNRTYRSMESSERLFPNLPPDKKEVARILDSIVKQIEKLDRDRRREEESSMPPLPDYIIRAGLAPVDPNGKSILPVQELVEDDDDDSLTPGPPQKMLSRLTSKIATAGEEEDEVNPANRTVFDEHPHEILLKFWNYVFDEKADFLGYVLLPQSFITHPPKGARAFELKTNKHFVLPGKEKMQIHGSVFVKLTPTKISDMRINIPEDAPDPHKLILSKRASTRGGRGSIALSGTEATAVREVEQYLLPSTWRLQIFKATHMTAVDKVDKSSPMCEVCWKGMVKKNNKRVFERTYVTIGETSVKPCTVDPDWKNDPTAIFELPPVWTDSDIPNRGPAGTPLTGGGFVAKNNIPKTTVRVTNVHQEQSVGDKIDKMLDCGQGVENIRSAVATVSAVKKRESVARTKFKKAVGQVAIATKLGAHVIENLEKMVGYHMEVFDVLRQAEEVERKCMFREEITMRAYLREECNKKEAPYVDEQRYFEREFSRLIERIREPPPILGRARFLMGSPMHGGGSITMCEDPGTHQKIDVISIPILYDEDEEELSRQISFMLGNPHINLIRVIDYSVHQVLGFSYTGHATVDERVAMICCEKLQAISMMEHMIKNWSAITDADFKTALIQVTGALAALHRADIIHRNIHPDCVMVKTKSHDDSKDEDSDDEDTMTATTNPPATNTSTSTAQSESHSDLPLLDAEGSLTLDDDHSMAVSVQLESDQPQSVQTKTTRLADKPLYQLGDFWFFHNPRKVGCQFSEGRADWGNSVTAPPEAGGFRITDKSDVWAFGLCVYTWATRGLHLNVHDGKVIDFEAVSTALPLKWGRWLRTLLSMCLQRNPKYRATAKDLYNFLVIAK